MPGSVSITFSVTVCGNSIDSVSGLPSSPSVLPELSVQLHGHALAGRHAEARALQRLLTPLGRLVTTTHGVPGLKAALDLAGYRGGEPRAPLLPVTPRVLDEIRSELARILEAV